MKDCCSLTITNRDKKCIRKSDKKVFDLPRRWPIENCKTPRGFTMKSSCAPYKDCHSEDNPKKKLRPKVKTHKK